MEQAVEQPRSKTIQKPGYKEAWEYVLSQLRADMKDVDYKTYVSALKPLSFKEGIFRVGAVSSFTRDWARDHLRRTLNGQLELILAQKVEVHFTLVSGDERQGWAEVPDAEPITPKAEAPDLEGGDKAARDSSAAAMSSTPEPEPADNSQNHALEVAGGDDAVAITNGTNGNGSGRKKKAQTAEPPAPSQRKIQLQRAYGSERAKVVRPEHGMFLTMYFFKQWLPLLSHSAFTTIIAARTLCYWNPMTGEMRNTVDTDMAELAELASVSVRTVKDVLNNELVKKYFLRYKVRRVMTPNGVRTSGITLQVRMDDPLTPEDQDKHNLPEDEHWYSADFEDEKED